MTPQESEQIRRDAQSNPEKAERDLVAKGATPDQAREYVVGLNPKYGSYDYLPPGFWNRIGQGVGWGLNQGLNLTDWFFGNSPTQSEYYAPSNNSPAAKRWRAQRAKDKAQMSEAGSTQYPGVAVPPSTAMPSTALAR
jgi:hypothetical protein